MYIVEKLIGTGMTSIAIDFVVKRVAESEVFNPATIDSATPFGIYTHIPFCPSLCPFCGFAKVNDNAEIRERYAKAVATHITQMAAKFPQNPINWVYFGGGTPSTLTEPQLAIIMDSLGRLNVGKKTTITMEMRVDDLEESKVEMYKKVGINRLSLGVQSFDDAERKQFALRLNGQEAAERLKLFREHEMEYGIDLIWGAPFQTIDAWRRTLDTSLEISPDQIDAYLYFPLAGTLTFKRGMGIISRSQRIMRHRRMSDLLMEKLVKAGYTKTNAFMFKKDDEEPDETNPYKDGSMVGMEGGQILGVGQSAHSLINMKFAVNPYTALKYVEMMERGEELTYVSARSSMLIDLIRNLASFTSRFGKLTNLKKGNGGQLTYLDKWKAFKSFQGWSNIYTIIRNWNTESTMLGYSTLNYRSVRKNAPLDFISTAEAESIQEEEIF